MPQIRRALQVLLSIILLGLIAIGVYYRFNWVDWNQDANLHPDEYGLTNTLTQLHMPETLGDYFNTRLSPISPYQKYDEAGQAVADGPDNRMRWGQWPIIILRAAAEMTGQVGYNELRLMGRYMAALIDTLTLLLIYLIGRRLYGHLVGLFGAALSALAVMQIQQSHFMTVDNYAVFFAALTMYVAVCIATRPPVIRQPSADTAYTPYQIHWPAVWGYILFGVCFGMTLSSKINLLPLGGMVLVAAFLSIADLKLRARPDLGCIFTTAALFLAIAGLATLLTFRLTQPMSFRAATGDTTLFTLAPNPDWTESMKVASQESSGIGGGPPSEQWADRPMVVFPLMNMIVWGMGIPLGLAGWAGFIWAAVQILRGRLEWRAHLLPVIWSGGYFIFMATRWVKSIRYFLPIYPFLCLLAAWALIRLFTAIRDSNHRPVFKNAAYTTAALAAILVTSGSLVWANAFVDAVYRQPHTRIQATQWILENIPAPFHIQLQTAGKPAFIQVPAPDATQIMPGLPFLQPITLQSSGKLGVITLPHVRNTGSDPVLLTITLSSDPEGSLVLDQATLQVPPTQAERGIEVQGAFQGAQVNAGESYFLTASTNSNAVVMIYQNTIANEDWDEGLPVPYAGYQPFGQYYQTITMNVRWTDNEEKRQGYLTNLAVVDYLILPSQRSIWSGARLPRMYPMTLEYYRTLFDGRLGFKQVAQFQAPFKIGQLQVSDVGGTLAWNRTPDLPRFNFNFFAAEEAFSVYDHPPVWIFKKQPNFSIQSAQAILNSVDLSTAAYQNPYTTRVSPIQ